MNNRMWVIAEKVKDQGPDFHYYDPAFLIEYTRLIVEECMDLVEDYTKQRTHTTFYKAEEQIKKNFGVDQ